jgi:hypothetical protein
MVHRAQIAVLIMNAAMGFAPPRKPRLRKPNIRGLHSSTSQINLSALYGIGVERWVV